LNKEEIRNCFTLTLKTENACMLSFSAMTVIDQYSRISVIAVNSESLQFNFSF